MKLQIYTSEVKDGNMKITDETSKKTVENNRFKFLKTNHIEPIDTVLVKITYDTNDYCKYSEVEVGNKGDGITAESSITADALYTNKAGIALFLPIADCIGAVIYNETKGAFMVSHLGRHSLEQNGGYNSVLCIANAYKINQSSFKVWMSPAVGSATYPLHSLGNKSLYDVATDQFIKAGIIPENIVHDGIDVANHPDYFSHSSFLKGEKLEDGRFAIVAMMTE
jgi:copper oxidase (laccase) domain-containing protein